MKICKRGLRNLTETAGLFSQIFFKKLLWYSNSCIRVSFCLRSECKWVKHNDLVYAYPEGRGYLRIWNLFYRGSFCHNEVRSWMGRILNKAEISESKWLRMITPQIGAMILGTWRDEKASGQPSMRARKNEDVSSSLMHHSLEGG